MDLVSGLFPSNAVYPRGRDLTSCLVLGHLQRRFNVRSGTSDLLYCLLLVLVCTPQVSFTKILQGRVRRLAGTLRTTTRLGQSGGLGRHSRVALACLLSYPSRGRSSRLAFNVRMGPQACASMASSFRQLIESVMHMLRFDFAMYSHCGAHAQLLVTILPQIGRDGQQYIEQDCLWQR